MQQVLVFIIAFGLIVTFHEFGHFYFAKRAGVLVREFAIGMGPKIFTKRHKGTTYTIRALPLGGYVRLAGQGDEVEPLRSGQLVNLVSDSENVITLINTQENRIFEASFPFEVTSADLEKDMVILGKRLGQETIETLSVSKTATLIEADGTEIQVAPLESQLEQASVWQRMLINIAGPINNFILGILFFMLAAFMAGGVFTNSNRVDVVESGPAYKSGLQSGDTILAVDGQGTDSWDAITAALAKAKSAGQTAVLVKVAKANGQQEDRTVSFENGVLGIIHQRDTGIWAKVRYGFTQSWHVVTSIVGLLAGMFKTGFDISQFGGPVAIVEATGAVAQQGLLAIVTFIALLSVNLGVMNLLPIPALDGGKIILNIIEIFRGKPLSREKETIVTLIGVGLLLILMIAVTFNDLQRLFFGS